MSLHKALPSFEAKGEGSLLPWFRTIVNRRVEDALRRYYCKDAPLAEHAAMLARPEEDGGRGPSERAEQRERAEHVHQAIDELPAQKRETAYLVLIQGYSYRETAEVLGDTPGAVRLRVLRAAEQVKRMLA